MARLIDQLYGNKNAEQTILSHFNKDILSPIEKGEQMLERINETFNKGLITEQTYEGACAELDLLVKAQTHKYIRREGAKGNYRYIYKEGEGPKGESSEKEVTGDDVDAAYARASRGEASPEEVKKVHDKFTEQKKGPTHIGDMSDKELHQAAKELGVKDHENMSGKALKTAVLNANVEKQVGEFKNKKSGFDIEAYNESHENTSKPYKQY